MNNIKKIFITVLVYGFLTQGALGANLIQDPSFEDGPPRALKPSDTTPWFGEEEGATVIMQGDAHSGSQFARMQAGEQSFLFNRFSATPNTDYTLTFWTRGTSGASITASARARFLGDCHKIPVGCPDEDGDEDLDLGPEPPDYKKLILNGTTVFGSSDWQQTSINFNSGKYTELGVVFYGLFTGTSHIDVDDVSVVEAVSSRSH